ncbi:MAG: hypothetical protein IPM35_36660 [Myxococcales bacterium]|nr:hypothetical protein [Myxococcales bacterium]
MKALAKLTAALALLASCGPAEPARAPAPPAASADTRAPSYQVVDATAPFWAFWQSHARSTPEARLAGFRELVIARNPALFGDGVIGRDPLNPDELGARLPPWLASLDARIDAMRALGRSVEQDLGRFDASFRQVFPDMSWDGTVYFTVSVDAFDGAVRRVDGRLALLFGLDKIALLYGPDASVGPLFHHELFHLHHQKLCSMPEPKPEGPNGLWPPLWTEGLAVYVSHHLNPKATLRELTLSPEMVSAADARMAPLAGELLRLLDDAREEDYRDYFLGAGQREDVPKRAGYYIGYRLARSLSKQMSFDRLVRLCGDELRTAIERELQRLIAAEPRSNERVGLARHSHARAASGG